MREALGFAAPGRKRLLLALAFSQYNSMTVYLDSEKWADLEPIEQDDGENPVVAIKYSVECEYPRPPLTPGREKLVVGLAGGYRQPPSWRGCPCAG